MEENVLYFEVRPSELGRLIVASGEQIVCVKCRKLVVAGRIIYKNGLCYRCEHKRVLKEAYLAEGRSRKLDREFKKVVSE